MTYQVILAEQAARELEGAARWWAENRSAEQAERWYAGFVAAIESLQVAPDRHPYACEEKRFAFWTSATQLRPGAARNASRGVH